MGICNHKMGNAIKKSVGRAFYHTDSEKLSDSPRTFFEVSAKDIKGKEVRFADFEGKQKAFIVVNVACLCGFAYGDYKALNQLFLDNKDKGLSVLAFPCNQFKNQESGSDAEIEDLVRSKFNAEFQLFSKIDVNGANTHPLYKFLRTHSVLHNKQTGEAKQVPWNFTKFLVDRNGAVVKMFNPEDSPTSFKEEVERLLK